MIKQISNMDELISDFQNRIKKNDSLLIKELKTQSGMSLEKDTENRLRIAADVLRSKIENEIQFYFNNYSPSVYQRTGEFEQSLKIAVFSQNNDLYATVYFDDNKALRDSLWNDQPKGYLPALLNDGYRVKSGWHKDIHHFGYFEGAHFIEAAIMEARKDSVFDGIEIIWEPHTSGYGMNY